MKKFEKKVIEENILTEVYCNKCGELIFNKKKIRKLIISILQKNGDIFPIKIRKFTVLIYVKNAMIT